MWHWPWGGAFSSSCHKLGFMLNSPTTKRLMQSSPPSVLSSESVSWSLSDVPTKKKQPLTSNKHTDHLPPLWEGSRGWTTFVVVISLMEGALEFRGLKQTIETSWGHLDWCRMHGLDQFRVWNIPVGSIWLLGFCINKGGETKWKHTWVALPGR